jgi:hypothetical protein
MSGPDALLDAAAEWLVAHPRATGVLVSASFLVACWLDAVLP